MSRELLELLRSVSDRKPIAVEVAEWGATLYMRPLSGRDRDELDARLHERASWSGLRAWVISRSLCHADGSPLVETERVEAEKLLNEKHGAIIDRLYTRAIELSALGGEAVDAAKKNS